MTDRLTHIALPCHSLEKTIKWYEDFTPLKKTHYRKDSDTSVAWLEAENNSMVIVFIDGNKAKRPIPTFREEEKTTVL